MAMKSMAQQAWRGWACATAAALALAASAAHAAQRDPWVPPQVRAQAAAAASASASANAGSRTATRGAALAAQVERKLRAQFDAADTGHTGRITAEQARAAGLGNVAEHFEQIDVQGRGSISFDDYKRYLRSRGARTL